MSSKMPYYINEVILKSLIRHTTIIYAILITVGICSEMVFDPNKKAGCLFKRNNITIIGRSYESCRDECRARTGCIGISHRVAFQVCVLGELGYEILSNDDCSDFVYSLKSSWKESSISCRSLTCLKKRGQCAPNGACIIYDCPPIEMTHKRIVYGVMRRVGSKRALRCREPFTLRGARSISCMSDGTWSPTPPDCVHQNQPYPQ